MSFSRRVSLGSAVTLAAVATLMAVPGPLLRGQERARARPATDLSKEENYQKIVEAARVYAQAVAGAETGYEYNTALDYALRGAVLAASQSPRRDDSGGPLEANKSAFVAPFSNLRRSEELQKSIFNDPVWEANWKAILSHPAPGSVGPSPRIWGGNHVHPGEFPACVAIGSGSSYCCSGTLIGRNVVVTAAHCVDGGCSSWVFFGDNANNLMSGVQINVAKSIAHPDYDRTTNANDIAILVLDADAPAAVTPIPVAATTDIDAARFFRAVGFGRTHTGGSGEKCKVDVAVATSNCSRPADGTLYGCHADKELVAGGNGLDTCNGDSGGPYFLIKGADIQLAGATSRMSRNSVNPCGDGGIAVRVDKYLQWIRDTSGMNGGKL